MLGRRARHQQKHSIRGLMRFSAPNYVHNSVRAESVKRLRAPERIKMQNLVMQKPEARPPGAAVIKSDYLCNFQAYWI
jgi:hypothetical protein